MAPTSFKYVVVDAFTTKTFGGNPAAVIVLDEQNAVDDQTLQLIAREFNIAETAFITPRSGPGPGSGVRSFGLRWFTPCMEFALCGHATLAATHVLSTMEELVPEGVDIISFETMSGELTAKRLPEEKIELELPAGLAKKVDSALEARVQAAIKAAMGFEPKPAFVGVGEGVSFGKYMLIELEDTFDLSKVVVNADPFLALAPDHCAMIVTTTASDPDTSFVSRVFGPAFGAAEDPVCGSAHCMLGPYWHQKLKLRRGEKMRALQVSARGGELEVIWDEQRGVCKLIGSATTVMKGELLLPAH